MFRKYVNVLRIETLLIKGFPFPFQASRLVGSRQLKKVGCRSSQAAHMPMQCGLILTSTPGLAHAYNAERQSLNSETTGPPGLGQDAPPDW